MRKYRGLTKEETKNFLGKYVKAGQWIYGYYFYSNVTGKGFILGEPVRRFDNWLPIEVDPETVGQSTGLFDKNGKEIYEGDIIRFPIGHCYKDFITCYVVFYRDRWSTTYPCKTCGQINCIHSRKTPMQMNKRDWDNCEILGTIHENKELLNETPDGKANKE